jgi:hypothetical protein
MKNLIRKVLKEEGQKLLSEGGIRDIKAIAKRYPMAKLYFHLDLDGVTTALAMKKYLEQNGIKVVDAEPIQYGDREFSVKKPEGEGDIMPVLVDFAHGKPMYVIHTDHHDTQAGVEKGTSTNFRPSRSNVETISQSISPKEIFTPEDIELISIVDSADFARNDLTPEQVMTYLYKFDRERDVKHNKRMMGFVANKLLLAFKNKKGFLSDIVLNAEPSLMSIIINIKDQIEKKGYAKIPNLEKNKEDYLKQMKSSPDVRVEDGIIVQYGGGSTFAPGSYERYTPYKNNPDADFMVLAWPMGMLQASCNPFKKDRALKGVNLGEIKDEVLGKWETQLKDRKIPLSTIKWVSESGKEFGEGSVGFTFKDFLALYGSSFDDSERSQKTLSKIQEMMEKPFKDLTPDEMDMLDSITVSAWDIIVNNSGGHKCITNISGLNYLGRGKRPPKSKYSYSSDKEDAAYVKFLKMLQREFVRVLKEKIKESGDERYEPEFEIEMNESIKKILKSHIKSNPFKVK